MTIYLIRHGQSEFNAAHNDGDPDPMIFDAPLTKTGRLQAERARAAAADLGITQVITSPLDPRYPDRPLHFRGHRADKGGRRPP